MDRTPNDDFQFDLTGAPDPAGPQSHIQNITDEIACPYLGDDGGASITPDSDGCAAAICAGGDVELIADRKAEGFTASKRSAASDATVVAL